MKNKLFVITLGMLLAIALVSCVSSPAQRLVDQSIVYYVDAGDDRPWELSPGEAFGTHNSEKDQPFSVDPVTGYEWGWETVGGWVYNEDQGPYYMDSIRTDEGGEVGKGLTYRFEVENGTYNVTLGFLDFWANGNRFMNVIMEGKVIKSDYLVAEAEDEWDTIIEVTDGRLDIEIVRADSVEGDDEDPFVNMITIRNAK